nr:DUF3014 domain-containing protein [Schlegelella koreensis]
MWPRSRPAEAPPIAEPVRVEQAGRPAEPAPPSASAVSELPIRHPIVAPPEAPPSADVRDALVDLFGRRALVSMFQSDDFARRFVATVDNLARRHAASRLWPVNPAPDRFMVESRPDGTVIAPDNALRYTPFVLLVETVDIDAAVATYRRFYPQFQQAYQELGYPGRYFNDRLVELIDLLLATPTADGELKVHLPPINGPIRPERPWVLYQYDDPALEALSSGQRLLLRMGPVNARRLKAKLAEVRRLVASDTDVAAPASGAASR